MDTPSVRVDKTFMYRGSLKTWSNRYHFNGGVPSDNTHWNTLFDAITAAEKALYKSDVHIVKAVGYDAGSDLPVHEKDYALAGTASFFSGQDVPGDCAAILRYSTTARSSRNHAVYLFNYFHGALGGEGGDIDVLDSDQRDAIAAYAALWIAGFSDGTITAVRAGPHGATATSALVLPEVRHRDFPA
jgi:hypothetical protein